MIELINIVNGYAILILHLLSIIVIMTGAVKALIAFVGDILVKEKSIQAIRVSRLEIGHAFSLGLALLIGASILKSIFAPTWNDIGKLVAIIVIRTVLNYFLTKEMENASNSK